MHSAIAYAFLSLVLTAVNDFVFKLFADKMRCRGGFISVVGVFWLLALTLLPMRWDNLQATIIWGIVSGFFSVSANILLIEAMARQSAGLCSTMYRLNMVFVIVMAYFMLNESISLVQFFGIVLALAAVIVFVPYDSIKGASGAGFLMALAASVLRAFMGISYKYAFINGVDKNAIVLVNSFFWIVPGFIYAIVRERQWNWFKDKYILKYGAISGLLVAGIVIGMAGSLNAGDASRVLPIAQMSFLGTFGLGVVFLKEKCDVHKVVALVFGVVAVILLTL